MADTFLGLPWVDVAQLANRFPASEHEAFVAISYAKMNRVRAEKYAVLKEAGADCIISLGGGSPHDCAKVIAVLATNGGAVMDYRGADKVKKTPLALIAINTTAGTASEITRFAVITEETKQVMKKVLKDIQTGEYAKSFILENRAGAPTLQSRRRLNAEHSIEVVGEQLRAMMPWIKKNKLVDQSRN